MNRPFITRRPGQMAHQWPTLGLLAGVLLLPMILAGCPGSLGAGFPAPGGGSAGGAPMATGTGGAAPSGGTGGMSGGAVCDAPTKVIMPSCAISGCHLGVFPPDLTTVDVAKLKTMIAGTSTAPCAGKPLINAANPAMSPLLLRVTGTTCGERMPDMLINPAVTYLSQTDIDCLTSWVTANAGN